MGAYPTVRVMGAGRLAERARGVVEASPLVEAWEAPPDPAGSQSGPDVGLVVADEPTTVVAAVAAAGLTSPGARLVVMTPLGGPDVLINAVAAGADGWLLPSACDHDLVQTLLALARGESGFSRDDTAVLVVALRRQLRRATGRDVPEHAAPGPALTPREREVHEALEAGHTTRDLADALSLSEVTVRGHARRAKQKIGEHAGAPGSSAAQAIHAHPVSPPPGGSASRGPRRSTPGPGPLEPVLRTTSDKGLTRSEMRVALLVAEGLSNKQIAEQLFISRHTVESHLKHSFVKLGVRSRVELTRLVLAEAVETG
jgi:DNA-binding NarL/FixJ family response regulator